jgi:hypothetical protein
MITGPIGFTDGAAKLLPVVNRKISGIMKKFWVGISY